MYLYIYIYCIYFFFSTLIFLYIEYKTTGDRHSGRFFLLLLPEILKTYLLLLCFTFFFFLLSFIYTGPLWLVHLHSTLYKFHWLNDVIKFLSQNYRNNNFIAIMTNDGDEYYSITTFDKIKNKK